MKIEVKSYGVRGIVPKNYEDYNLSFKDLKEYIKKTKYKKVYITCDFDVFNTNFISSVSYPVVNGIEFDDFKEIIDIIKNNKLKIIGIDFVEFNANRGIKDISACNASQVIYYAINKLRK